MPFSLTALLKPLGLLAILTLPTTVMAERVSLQSAQSDRFVCAFGAYVAAQCAARDAHVFDMVRLNGGQVAFRDPVDGRYLRAGLTENSYVGFSGGTIGSWQRFDITQRNGIANLRSAQNGQYVRAGIGQESLLGAVSPHARGWEEFRIIAAVPAPGPAPAITIDGTWYLQGLTDASARPVNYDAVVPRGRPISIDADGVVNFNFGCNSVSAQFEQRGDSLSLRGSVIATRMACQGDANLLEREMATALRDTVTFVMQPNRLMLRDHNGIIRVVLTR